MKTADDPSGVARLAHEAAILRRIAQPGVVDVVDFRSGPNRAELSLVRVPGETFDRFDPPTVRELAAVVATTAAIVAHVHEAGVAHGRLTADHIVVGPGSRPVICGFGDAVTLDAEWSSAAADDVAALGKLLAERVNATQALRDGLAAADDAGRADAVLSRRLATIAARAISEDPLARPSARRLAGELRSAIRPQPKPRGGRHLRKRHRGVALPRVTAPRRAAAIGFAAVVLTGAAVSVAVAVARPEKPLVPETSFANAPSCPERPPAALVADVDGDGCADAVELATGVVVVNGERFAVGQPGDAMALGRWNCDGPRTLALLRPADGRVFVFDGWPSVGNETTPRLVATVKGATALHRQPGSDDCDLVRVTNRNGTTTDLDARRTEGRRP